MVRCWAIEEHREPVEGFFFCVPVRSGARSPALTLHVYADLCIIMHSWTLGRGRA